MPVHELSLLLQPSASPEWASSVGGILSQLGTRVPLGHRAVLPNSWVQLLASHMASRAKAVTFLLTSGSEQMIFGPHLYATVSQLVQKESLFEYKFRGSFVPMVL